MNLNAELTKRETEVAEFIAWGAAEKQIAYKLRIAIKARKLSAAKIGVEYRISEEDWEEYWKSRLIKKKKTA